MNTALVHDYLNQRGGAERVFAHFARAWPAAPVYTALYDERAVGDLVPPERVRTSFLQRFPLRDKLFRTYAPFYPRAIESFDLSAFDLVVSSTTAWAKGVVFRPDAVHVCYINTVSRFVFDEARYVGGFGLSTLARPLIRRLAAWDVRAAQRPTRFIANSRNVAERVRRWYGRDADVLPCPVDVDRFTPGAGEGNYYVVVSRLLPYKRIDLAIDACALAGATLHIAGTGPDEKRLKRRALGTNTVFHGSIDDAARNALVGGARAAILPGEEDFGLVPLEAAAAGRPTIAYGAGGALETIAENETGAFFREPAPRALADAIRAFDPAKYDPARLRAHAEQFRPERFVARLRAIVDDTLNARASQRRAPAG
ncbi:MAG: glycosyl transferase, group 1 [Candidatus Eremiobacteraeota bacterium]|nr:glycosyl transferase, group 1 [Candidatus Eremiobacteraeota bacterium]